MTRYTDHHAPEGLLIRGTIVVVPGRGETRATYARLGRRLAVDAYRVRVLDAPEFDAEDAPEAFGARLEEAVAGTVEAGDHARPLVLVGSDSGAALIAAFLARAEGGVTGPRPDAVVLAGLPSPAAGPVDTWDAELDARTSCPTHRGVLSGDDQVRRGALNDPVPGTLLDAVHDGGVEVPALLLVGDADPLADRGELARTAKSLPRARLAVVRGAHHDVLNDLQHRAVAAEVVTFLETLRSGLVPAVVVESSAW